MGTVPFWPEPEGFWLTEQLTPGHRRQWSEHARAYSADIENRQHMTEAIDAVRWHRINEELPYSSGLLLREMLRAMPETPLAVGISDRALEFPEAHLLDKERDLLLPDQFATYPVVAMRLLVGRFIITTYYFDEGFKASPFATDMAARSDRPGPESAMCAAELHELCRGRVRVPGGTSAKCRCDCTTHGHAKSRRPDNDTASSRVGNRENQSQRAQWNDTIAEAVASLPHSAWTTVVDLAELVQRPERAVREFLHHSRTEGHHRVLTETGSPRNGTAFAGTSADQRRAQLAADGLRFTDAGTADPAQRFSADQLRHLMRGNESEGRRAQ